MSTDFFEAIKIRRSIYAIDKKISISDDKLEKTIVYAIENAPTPFNNQNGRVVLLLGKNHDKLWDIVRDTIKKIVPAEKFEPTEIKLSSFKSGYGTILFFEDMDTVKSFQEKFDSYKDNFPKWSKEAIGMLQYMVWTSLACEGIGATVQHYNPLIDEEVAKVFNIPKSWSLVSQMPFGTPISPAGEKEIMPIEKRFKIFK